MSNFQQYTGGSGKANPSLSPVTIGWVNMQGGPPSQTFPEATRAAQATVKMINTELGGVHGHPVQLSTCFIATSEAQGTTCGQQMANNKNIQAIVEGIVAIGNASMYGVLNGSIPTLKYRGERLDTAAAYRYFPALEPLASRRVGLLSGGEQQMLAVGRALARQPKLLLIDELSLGLAPIIVERLLPVVREYAGESGCGALLVEQHVELALAVADRGYVLAHGEIAASGASADLQANTELVLSSYLGDSALPATPDSGAGGADGAAGAAGGAAGAADGAGPPAADPESAG